MHQHTTRAAVVAASVLVSAPAPGQDDTTVSPVVVTATRTAQTADEAVAPVTVITREQIEDSGATTLPDVLAGQAGVDLSRSGAFGKSTTVNLRGLGNGKVLFLVNGSRIADPSSVDGAPSIQHIPASQIERIEIVRGPRSALYGSEALGGVINIITRQADDAGVEASIGYGSYNSKRADAGISGRSEQLGYNLSVSSFETDGYDVRDDGFDDDDGYDNASASGRLRYTPSDRYELNLDFLVDEGTTEFDSCRDVETFAGPFGDCHTDFSQSTVGVGGTVHLTDRWDSSVRVSRNREERRNFYQGDTFNNEFDAATTSASWQNDIQVGSTSLFTLGVEGSRDSVDRPEDFAEDERDRAAVFGQWQTHAGAHDVVLGLRGIDDEEFGSHTVGSLDYGFQVVDGLRLLASAGTAFKAPSLFQLYSPQFGNDDLDPEKSATIEFGIAGQAQWGDWSVRTYRTQVRDLIDFVSGGYENVADEVEINGLELETSATLRGWNTSLAYSWNEPVDEDTGSVLPNRAERSFRLAMSRSFGRLRTGGSIEAQSRRTGGDFSDPVAGYGILNLHAGYRLSRDWRVRATMENVADKDYQLNDQFFGAGRTTFVHLTYGSGGGI